MALCFERLFIFSCEKIKLIFENSCIFTKKNRMKITVLLFGIVGDLTGESRLEMDLTEGASVGDFKIKFHEKYPILKEYTNYAIAVNEAYALDEVLLKNQDVLAVIPPVSGG
jgi:molybdopterin synthase sulfur carrier subunit